MINRAIKIKEINLIKTTKCLKLVKLTHIDAHKQKIEKGYKLIAEMASFVPDAYYVPDAYITRYT